MELLRPDSAYNPGPGGQSCESGSGDVALGDKTRRRAPGIPNVSHDPVLKHSGTEKAGSLSPLYDCGIIGFLFSVSDVSSAYAVWQGGSAALALRQHH